MGKLGFYINEILNNEIIKNDDIAKQTISSIVNRLKEDEFRLAIVGEFSSGKSTFINSIIGRDILKHATIETTAVVTYIHNVKKNNELYNKCKVTFKNGDIRLFDNYNDIKEYTTTISKYDVVNEIDRVDLYLNFLSSDKNLVLVDTPGLNGIADKHREITITEIEKAHACIYLFQKNGITDSDKEFIKLLSNYQNRFIFIQNFIDELKKSENEIVEDKIKYIECFINEKIFKDNKLNIKYDIFGISALKALAAKDNNIEYLYEGDLFKLDNDRRKVLLSESNILKVEENIFKILESEEVLEIVENSIRHALINILDDILERENSFQNRNYEFLKNDKLYKNKDKLESSLINLNKEEENIIKKIDNLVISAFNNGIKLLKDDIEENVLQIKSDIENLIDLEKDYEKFNYKYKNKYYVNQLKLLIDKYKSNLEINEYTIIKNIYKTIFNRLNYYTNYSIKEIKSFESVKFNASNIKEVNLEFNEKESEINKLKEVLNKNRVKLINEKKIIEDLIYENEKVNYLENELKDELKKIENERNLNEKKLGEKPKIKIIGYKEIGSKQRKVLGHDIWKKKTKQSIPIYNDENRVKWERVNRKIKIEYINNKSKIEKEIEKIKERKMKLQNNIEISDTNSNRNKLQINYLENQIKVKQEELEIYKTIAKKEYLVSLKKHLKDDIENYLNKDKDNVKDIFIEKMLKDMNINKERIRLESKKNCIDYLEKEKKRLNDLITESRESLESKYKKNEKYIIALNEVYRNLMGEN